ncbi:hypothetical protein DSO57_1021042 [Entomophthora muscae]|uniref:Uncharacterized protein n=1 Tax=Entomophthora muscae TaxID=34485 RepID=A0ACC2SG75_9FUNG|nr:hypothetical protein DSO57_1021042 [Entomophthora muscae]
MVAACVYCAVVVCLTIVSLRRKASVLDRVQSNQRRHSTLRRDIRRLIMRVSLYCIIPVLTQIWFVVFKVHWHYTQSLNKTLVYLSVVGSGTRIDKPNLKDLPGVLNLLALFLDPAFANALRAIRKGPKYPDRPISSFSVSRASTYTLSDSFPTDNSRVDRLLSLLSLKAKHDPSLDVAFHKADSPIIDPIPEDSFVRSL